METRNQCRASVKVSILCFDTMTFGTNRSSVGEERIRLDELSAVQRPSPQRTIRNLRKGR